MADPIEVAAEQEFLDKAAAAREAERSLLDAVPEAAAHGGAALGLFAFAEASAKGLGESDSEAAFGSVQFESGEWLRVGRAAISSGPADLMVMSWRAPAAAAFYEASVEDPRGLAKRREFRLKDHPNRNYKLNELIDFDEVVFADLAERVDALLAEPEATDALLDRLAQHRSGEMRDIVATIQAAQYELIRSPLDEPLLIQGAPGTGKTAVALHRVAWLLFNERDRLQASDVLVIGPSRAFVRYIDGVLPSLGEEGVTQISLAQLGFDGAVTLSESEEVRCLKGQDRMAGLLRRALAQRVNVPDEDVHIGVGRRRLTVPAEEIGRWIDSARSLRWVDGRRRLRERLIEAARATVGPGESVPATKNIDRVVNQIWPQLNAQAFVRELLGSEARLLRAAGEDFTAHEVQLLHRRSADKIADQQWSDADVALIDEATWLISSDAAPRWKHIVVDEAQDLTPMQLRSVRRRMTGGSVTILGDVAQATVSPLRHDWSDVAASFGVEQHNVRELAISYRLPSQVFRFVEPLIERLATGISVPRVIRDGHSDPILREFSAAGDGDDAWLTDMSLGAATAAGSHASAGRSVGVICSQHAFTTVREWLDLANTSHRLVDDDPSVADVCLLLAAEAKGLEFDVVIVVDAEGIGSRGLDGLRELYIAYTRTTDHLEVLHRGDPLCVSVDAPLGEPRTVARRVEAPGVGDAVTGDAPRDAGSLPGESMLSDLGSALVSSMAAEIASQVRAVVDPRRWAELVEELGRQLGGAGDEPISR